ncbi:hypothetical protein Tco_0514994 [Tanacetum coccineum]
MLAPSYGGLIIYQAYGNLYAMTVARDGVAGIKRRRRDQSSDDVRNLATASGRGLLKEDLESSTLRRLRVVVDSAPSEDASGIVSLVLRCCVNIFLSSFRCNLLSAVVVETVSTRLLAAIFFVLSAIYAIVFFKNHILGLASIEERIIFYKNNEVIFTDQIVVLKSDASFNEAEIIALKSYIEKLKKEKEDNLLKINNYDNVTKSLDKVIGSQLVDNNKKGLGYNAVPPPPTGLFAPLIIDLSHSGIEKFKEPEFEGYGVKVDKCVSETSPKEIKKTPDAPIIEEWVSDDEEQDKSKPKSEKKTVIPTVKKKELLTANKKKNIRNKLMSRAAVNAAKLKAVHNAVKRNWFHDVKASTCWIWRPKQKEILDNVSKHNSAGRKITEIDQDPGISLVQHDAEIQGRHEHESEFDFDAARVSELDKEERQRISKAEGLIRELLQTIFMKAEKSR